VFSWSLPFLAEKVSSMLITIVKKCNDVDEEGGVDLEEVVTKGSAANKKLLNIKTKI
jgi:serine/threonine-protein phosphatase 2B catalytic subunit